jgi:HK97 family phage major capsid protein
VKLFDLKKLRAETVVKAELISARAEQAKRQMTEEETATFNTHMAEIVRMDEEIKPKEDASTLRQFDPVAMLSGTLVRRGESVSEDVQHRAQAPLHPAVAKHNLGFMSWARNVAGSLMPVMEASDPSGVIGESTGTGMYPANFATPLEVLPFEKSYIQYAPFERAGARVIPTSHMRDVNVPVIAAGAEPTQYAEAQGPASGASGSQPFALSGFTMKAYKKSRQVIADWESLMSTEYPLQPMILDELLTAIANAHTHTATMALYSALTAPPGVTLTGGALPPLQVGGSGVEADVYGQMTALRHSLVDGLEDPSNCWMLSRNTLATIRNTRASTSGAVMFDPEEDLILGRPYVANEFFDAVCGAGFVAYGNWNRGAFLRRTPLLTRVLQELYSLNNQLGFLVTQWADNHFLAELVGATNPPSHQPIYYTVLPSGALP